MLPPARNSTTNFATRVRAARRGRRGFTMIDTLMGMMITGMLCMAMSGVIMGVTAGWDHTTGMEDASQQARVSMDRISYMLSQAGVYKVSGQSTVDGIAVVDRVLASVPYPEILVIWSGGPNGGMSAAGLQTRLPLVSELVIYAPRSDDPSKLVEINNPSDSSSVDFNGSTFSTTILSTISSAQSTKTQLSDRVHLSTLPSTVGGISTAGNIRFECVESPSATALSGISLATAAWVALPWAQGIQSSTSGLRQTTVRMEFQLNVRANGPNGSSPSTVAFPFLGSASFSYVYVP